MDLVRRGAAGRGAGGWFYACSRREDERRPCKACRKPVNRTAARERSRQKVPRIILRDYQVGAVETIRRSFQGGQDRVVVSLATGAGKTSVANGYLDKHESEAVVLWTAPGRELLEQAEMNSRGFRPDRGRRYRVGLGDVMPDIPELPRQICRSGGAVVYATEQAIFRRLKSPAKGMSGPEEAEGLQMPGRIPDLIVVDECHWAGLTKIGMCILKWARYHGIRVLGLTATPLPAAPLPVVHVLPLVQLAKLGVLAWPRLWRVERLPDLPLCVTSVFDMRNHQEELPLELPPADMAIDLTEVVDVYEGDAERWGKTLIKVASIEDADDLVRLCRQRNLRAATVNARTPLASRQGIIQDFRGGALEILVVIGIGNLGLDLPALRTIFLTHAMGSPNAYSQLLGRGARKFDVDYFNVVEFHPRLARMRGELWRAPVVQADGDGRALEDRGGTVTAANVDGRDVSGHAGGVASLACQFAGAVG